MKKIIPIILGACVLLAVSCKSSQTSSAIIESTEDTVSYGLGFVFAKNVTQQLDQAGVELDSINKNLLLQGFSDVLDGNDSLVSVDRLDIVIQTYVEEAQKAKLLALTAEETAFLDSNKKMKGVVVLPSGLQY